MLRILGKWPGGGPGGWVDYVNEPISPRELARLETSERRGRPYGEDCWVMKMVSEMGLEYTVRDPWRPKKVDNG